MSRLVKNLSSTPISKYRGREDWKDRTRCNVNWMRKLWHITVTRLPIVPQFHSTWTRAEDPSQRVDTPVGTPRPSFQALVDVLTLMPVDTQTRSWKIGTWTAVRPMLVHTRVLARSVPVPQQALVHVLARLLVVGEAKTLGTGTVVGARGVPTQVGAVVGLVRALVDICFK